MRRTDGLTMRTITTARPHIQVGQLTKQTNKALCTDHHSNTGPQFSASRRHRECVAQDGH